MKSFSLFSLFSVFGLMVLLSACGSNSTRDRNLGQSGLSDGSGSPSSSSAAGSTGNIYNLPLAPERVVEITGPGGMTPAYRITAETSRTLKIKVAALPAPHLTVPGYTNWVFPYGCLRIRVTVNGTTQATQVLRVADAAQGSNSPCANAPTSQVLDFSNAMTGDGPVDVVVSSPDSDNCRTSNPLYYGCQMSAVWMNHMAAANVSVQTDGTWLNP
jgi:hypothetical protein